MGDQTNAVANGVANLPPSVLDDARLVYNYHRLHMPLPLPARQPSAIFCLCSLDTRVATFASQLYLSSVSSSSSSPSSSLPPPLLIFSGDAGALTEHIFDRPEAEVFASIARRMGVPDSAILVEPRARNTGENVRFTYDLLQEKAIKLRSVVLVQKPYMERRTYATFMKQWPEENIEVCVTSPPVEFDEYPDGGVNGVDKVIGIMVGDLRRMREYPRRGFQIEQEIPEEVELAGERLIAAGYDGYLP